MATSNDLLENSVSQTDGWRHGDHVHLLYSLILVFEMLDKAAERCLWEAFYKAAKSFPCGVHIEQDLNDFKLKSTDTSQRRITL